MGMHLDQRVKLTCLSTVLSFFLFPFLSGHLPTGSAKMYHDATNFFFSFHICMLLCNLSKDNSVPPM